MILSTHLVDEASALFDNVVVIDRGRVALDAAADDLRGMVTTVSGPALAVNAFSEGVRSGNGANSGPRPRSSWWGRCPAKTASGPGHSA